MKHRPSWYSLAAWRVHREQGADLTGLNAAERAERPLFCGLTKAHALTGQKLSDKVVVRLVKQTAAAADRGADMAELMWQTRHKSVEVALTYLRPADLWRRNVTEGLLAPHAKAPG